MALQQIKRLSLLYQPMTVEKIKLRANHNIKATSLLLADIRLKKVIHLK
jgi:hypothetical protein